MPKRVKKVKDDGVIRQFATGATRDTSADKYDYEGFLSPLVIERYAEYMHSHRKQSDGSIRDSDNWQKGMPKQVYMKSAYRHFMDMWLIFRSNCCPPTRIRPEGEEVTMEDALCGLLFNIMGYLHVILQEKADSSK